MNPADRRGNGCHRNHPPCPPCPPCPPPCGAWAYPTPYARPVPPPRHSHGHSDPSGRGCGGCDRIVHYMQQEGENNMEMPGDMNRDMGRDMGRDMNRDMGRDMDRSMGRDMDRSMGRDMGRDMDRNMGRDMGRDMDRNMGRDMDRSMDRDMGRDMDRDMEMDQDMNMEDTLEDKKMSDDYEYMPGMMTPQIAKVHKQVREAADQMEYEGSKMFDEYPDKNDIDKLVREITATLEGVEPEIEDLVRVLLMYEMLYRRWRFFKWQRHFY